MYEPKTTKDFIEQSKHIINLVLSKHANTEDQTDTISSILHTIHEEGYDSALIDVSYYKK